jgi:diguanylate cyclase (GGDEF)-like protein/PAS domain S-box-containing protein
VLIVGLCYLISASLSVSLTRFEGGVALIWPATAILLADLRLRPVKAWPVRLLVCGVAGATATTFLGFGPVAALPLAFANMAEAALGALLMRRLVRKPGLFRSMPELGLLVAVSGLLMPAVTAFVGGGVSFFIAGAPFWPNWLGWFTAHGLGAIMFLPLTMLILSGDIGAWARNAGRRDRVEAAALLLLLASVTSLVFAQVRLPLLFLPFLPMMIAVFRLGRIGAAASIIILATIGSVLTLKGLGPISLIEEGAGFRAGFLQLYLATAMLMALPAAANLKRRQQLFSQLQESAALYQIIADRTGDIIMATQIDGTIRYVSPSMTTIGGYDPAELVGVQSKEIIYPEDVAAVTVVHRRALCHPDETFMVEYRAVRASGEYGWFESHMRAMVAETGTPTGIVSIIREVSERKDKEMALATAAGTDPLTGLANRRAFEAAFERQVAVDANRIGCIALFDLDHFKLVNDSQGHATGDEVLKAFAAILRTTVRGSDVVARLGGEEFAAILAGADLEQACAVCERVRQSLSDKAMIGRDGLPLRVTVSAGIVSALEGTTLAVALEAADEALYRAKAAGRNRLVLAA